MKNKIIIIVLVILLLIIGVIVSIIYKQKKTTVQPPIQNQQPQNEEKKVEPKEAEEEITEEVVADPELVTVNSLSGSVVSVSEESITINTGEKEESYKLIEKESLGIFKGTGDNVSIITLDEIKQGDKVTLEARQSDNMVNAIVVE